MLENFQIGELWIGRDVRSPALEQLENLARARGIPIRNETRGQSLNWDGVEANVLWPEPDSAEVSSAAKNNDSVVLHLQFRDRSFFLSGDAEFQAESAILSENAKAALQSDVLKVGPHGSKNSTTPELLAAVHPQWAVISSGAENPYGHPSQELLQRLRNANVRILRTDQNGAIHIRTDGNSLEVSCFLDCSRTISATDSVSAQPPDHQQKN